MENGFDNINWMDVGISTLIGGVTGAFTGGAIAGRIAATTVGKTIGAAAARVGTAVASAGRSIEAAARSIISSGTKMEKIMSIMMVMPAKAAPVVASSGVKVGRTLMERLTIAPSGLNKSLIRDAVKRFKADANKMKHALTAKHNLESHSIGSAGRLAKKTLWHGKIGEYGKASIATLEKNSSQVTFIMHEGKIKISDMWIYVTRRY